MYPAVFFGTLVMDLIPVIAPPAWMLMVFLMVKFDLNPWLVLAAGVPGSTLGRYFFSQYVRKFSNLFMKPRKNEELEFLGQKLTQKLWRSWVFVFAYTLTPISTTPLFTAAGMAKVKPVQTLPPFICGKFVSDAVLIFTGRYAVEDLKDILHGTFSWKGIILAVTGLVVVGGLLSIDWRELLEKKKFKFDFKILK